jgi:hypothetical protein
MRNEVMAAASDVTYGTWKDSDSPYQIQYALPVFREIEFYVGEGFRRISYGGIEHGGLLFGRRADSIIYLEAFRPIECEHASGPSFSLTEKDRTVLKQQLASYEEQPELSGLVPAGLFISHSRRDLRVGDDELNLLHEFFGEPWQSLVIVKPEKFKPAQFAFVLRSGSASNGTNLAESAFVLPSPPRAERKSRRPPPSVEDVPEPSDPSQEPKSRAARARKTAAKLKPVEEAQPAAEIKEMSAARGLPMHGGQEQPPAAPIAKSWLHSRLLAALILLPMIPIAACFTWFYWHYVEAPIEIHAALQAGHIVVTWPPQTTAAASRVRLRIRANQQDRQLVVSPDQRNAGRAEIAADSNDVTVELVASYWLHERRGLIRVIGSR